MSEESIIPPAPSDNSLSPKLNFIHNANIAVEFKGSSLKQDKTKQLHRNMVNLFIAHELDTWSRDLNEKFILDDCLFGAVKLNEVVDPNKNRCSRYDIGFEARSRFHCQLVNGVKMLLFLRWATVHQGILVIEKKIF